jgi:hypothetical protein
MEKRPNPTAKLEAAIFGFGFLLSILLTVYDYVWLTPWIARLPKQMGMLTDAVFLCLRWIFDLGCLFPVFFLLAYLLPPYFPRVRPWRLRMLTVTLMGFCGLLALAAFWAPTLSVRYDAPDMASMKKMFLRP